MNNLSKTHAEHDLSPDERKKRDGQRRGKTFRFRVVYGVKALLCKPWKFTFVALLGAAFPFCWLNRDIATSYMLVDFPILPDIAIPILSYTLYTLIIVSFVLLLTMLLCVMGNPSRAHKIDRALLAIFKDVGYGYWPIYLSCQREGNVDLWRYEFYSEHIPIETWEANRIRLVNMLGGYIESIENGGKHNNDVQYIVVFAGKGAKPVERETPKDPLFKK